MKIQSQNINYNLNSINTANASNKAVFKGQESDSFEISNKQKVKTNNNFLNSFNKVFGNTDEQYVQKNKLPKQLDLAFVRLGVISKRTHALCFRYGNTDISRVNPDVLNRVKINLAKMGINDIDASNMKLVTVGDGENSRFVNKVVSYYDKDSDKSIVFTPEGDNNYMLKYEYSPSGNIKGMYISDAYSHNDGKWYEK